MENWLNVLETHKGMSVVVNSEVDKYLLDKGFEFHREENNSYSMFRNIGIEYFLSKSIEDEFYLMEMTKELEKYLRYFKYEKCMFVLRSSIIIKENKYDLILLVLSNRILCLVNVENRVPLFYMKAIRDNIEKSSSDIEKDLSELLHSVVIEMSSTLENK